MSETVDCDVHGPGVPIDKHHHPVMKHQGGRHKVPICRYCHQELHRHDPAIHRFGWEGLLRALSQPAISDYMRSLALRRNRLERERLGDEAYSERMSQMARERWKRSSIAAGATP